MSRIRLKIIAITIICLSLFAISVFAQQNTREIFARAQMLDESNQNLSEAIKLYSQVVSQSNEQRALAARAQYRIGVLYERLGRKADAQRAYQAVVKQYSDQPEASRARAKQPAAVAKNLAAKGKRPTSENSGLTVRQVWAIPPGAAPDGTLSPDGRTLSFTDWGTGDLAVHNLVTRENHRLTGKGSALSSVEYADSSAVSPDEKQVAYAWYNKDTYELRVIGMDGSKPRVIYRNEAMSYLQPFAWSPDGKQILVLLYKQDRTAQIAFVSAADGSVRVLKSLEWRTPGKLSISPDGRYIAYDATARQGAPERDIFVLTTDGSSEAPLIQHSADDYGPVWTPDGRRVIFVSNRTGTYGAWMMAFADGKPQGAPDLMKSDLGSVSPLGFSSEGSYYYALRTNINDSYVAEIDPTTGKLLAKPVRLADRFIGYSGGGAVWSPDGQYLAYKKQRGPATVSTGNTIVIRSLKTDEEREMSPKLIFGGLRGWFPDGRSFLVPGNDNNNRMGFYRIDAQTAVASVIVPPRIDIGRIGFTRVALSPDGKTVFYGLTNQQRKIDSIMAHEIESGEEKELYQLQLSPSVELMTGMAVSPDGRHLAFFEKSLSKSLKVIPVSGGSPRELLRGDDLYGNFGLAWTPNGHHLLIVKNAAQPPRRRLELWRVPVEGGEAQKLELGMADDVMFPRIHPEGRWLAFDTQSTNSAVWVMENFLPVTSPRKATASRR